jgi:nitrous oxide reductase
MGSNEPTEEKLVAPAINAVPWWRDATVFTKVAALITSLVTALAGLGTVGTSYLVEKTKLRAQVESLDAKRISDSEDRKDKNAAAERELRTKYVDLALQPALGVDHRARIFGYLSTVLESEAQRKWATEEAQRVGQQRADLSRLRDQLDKALANSTSSTRRYLETLAEGGLTEVAIKALKTQHENEQEQIDLLRVRIRELEGGQTGPVP